MKAWQNTVPTVANINDKLRSLDSFTHHCLNKDWTVRNTLSDNQTVGHTLSNYWTVVYTLFKHQTYTVQPLDSCMYDVKPLPRIIEDTLFKHQTLRRKHSNNIVLYFALFSQLNLSGSREFVREHCLQHFPLSWPLYGWPLISRCVRRVAPISKLDGLASLITYPRFANFTIIHSWVVCQDVTWWYSLDHTAFLHSPANTEPMVTFSNPSGLRISYNGLHYLSHEYLHYCFHLGLLHSLRNLEGGRGWTTSRHTKGYCNF